MFNTRHLYDLAVIEYMYVCTGKPDHRFILEKTPHLCVDIHMMHVSLHVHVCTY